MSNAERALQEVEAEELAGRVRNIYERHGGDKGIAAILMHKDDIPHLDPYEYFDSKMKNSEYGVRGHIWEVAVKEHPYTRPGLIGVELLPEELEGIEPLEVKPWFEEVYGAERNCDAVDLVLGRFDTLLTWGLLDKALREFRTMDLSRLSEAAVLTALVGLRPRSCDLPWDEIVGKVEADYARREMPEDEMRDLLQGLREPAKGHTAAEFAAAVQGKSIVIPD